MRSPSNAARPLLLAIGVAICLMAGAAPRRAGGGEASADPWQPLRFLVGEWRGTAAGEPGSGTVTRRYDFVLGGRFLHERNTSTYLPRGPGGAGEVHEHWSFFSIDRLRQVIRFRQFHQEGFVNTYIASAPAGGSTKLVFESEHIENFAASWRARETYEILSADEFVEIFELAPPGKPFEVYSRNHFRRVP